MFVKYLIYVVLFQIIQSATIDYSKGFAALPDELNEIPIDQLTVVYNGRELQPGDELTPFEVRYPPQLSWPSKPNHYYHLLVCDIDAPIRNNNSLSPFKQWLVVNIPGTDMDKGETIDEYIGGSPQKNAGSHRYVFLLFESPNTIVCDDTPSGKNSLRNRAKYDLIKFRGKYGFNRVYAGNYYEAQWDPYVDEFDKYLID